MIIYLDNEYKCHLVNDGTMMEVETPFFDGKCQTFIEGYRYVPHGHSRTNERGITFTGEMIAPWKPYGELAAAQAQYEQMMAEAEAAYRE